MVYLLSKVPYKTIERYNLRGDLTAQEAERILRAILPDLERTIEQLEVRKRVSPELLNTEVTI